MAAKAGAVTTLLLLGGAVAGAFLIAAPSTATAAPAKKPAPLPGTPVPSPFPTPVPVPAPSPSGCQLDPNIDPTLRAQVNAALASTALTPADYEAVAQTADQANYPMAAACLRQKGNAVKTQQQINLDTLGGMPFTIRQGDIPSGLAQYYTGSGARFHELEPLNPQLGSIQSPGGVSNYYNAAGQPTWIPGVKILIPKSWDPLSKPLPPPAGM